VPAQPFYRRMGHSPDLYPNAQNFYREALSIPLFYELFDAQQDEVIKVIKELVG
jgi:dTDP-4-amino-4,6-dideoxygalactose transaminase